MAQDGKYGQVSTERGSIGHDEPVVVFRAQDALLPQLLTAYLELCHAAGAGEHHLAVIRARKAEIARWQRVNRVKVPDTTPGQVSL